MKICTRCFVIATALCLRAYSVADAQAVAFAPCSGIELVEGEREYNALVCNGKALLEKGLYSDAVKSLEAASKVGFFEYPNYKVLTLLARAHLLAGDLQRGTEVLEVARLTLSVLGQVVRCSDSGSSPITLLSRGQPLTSTAAQATAELMCGGMYEPYWESRPSLNVFVQDAELIQEFLRVEAEFAKAGR